MPRLNDQIKDLFRQAALKGDALKATLREIVRENWPGMPPWTTLDAPVIQEVQTATAGSGVVLTFVENGVRQVVLAQAGGHYPQAEKSAEPLYMIPGGFINLTRTPGSSLVPASASPEDGRTGAAREIEEEFKKPDGAPLLQVAPDRLKPMDTKTLLFKSGERRIVMGFMLELSGEEIATVKAHVSKLAADPGYRDATSRQSLNHDSGKPEVDTVAILPLDAAADGSCKLLHQDQQSLFQAVRAHFAEIRAAVAAQPRP
jgi:hypothetical protein